MEGAIILGNSMIITASYYTGDLLTGIILGEPGTLRGVADQMNGIKNNSVGAQEGKAVGSQAEGTGKGLMNDINTTRLHSGMRVDAPSGGGGPAPGPAPRPR
jgi:hypothetical protein